MRLVHSECGGELKIDRGKKVEIYEHDGYMDVLFPIKCGECNQPLGLLPNIDEEDSLVH